VLHEFCVAGLDYPQFWNFQVWTVVGDVGSPSSLPYVLHVWGEVHFNILLPLAAPGGAFEGSLARSPLLEAWKTPPLPVRRVPAPPGHGGSW
jgi:hypothetical protein